MHPWGPIGFSPVSHGSNSLRESRSPCWTPDTRQRTSPGAKEIERTPAPSADADRLGHHRRPRDRSVARWGESCPWWARPSPFGPLALDGARPTGLSPPRHGRRGSSSGQDLTDAP